MKEFILTIVLAFLCGVLSVEIIIGSYKKDNLAPEITVKREMVYVEGEDESVLLEGVKAIDDRDGDVSESLRIEKIQIKDDTSATVTYVAKDSSNNIGVLYKDIIYQKNNAENEEEQTKSDDFQQLLEKPKLTLIQTEDKIKLGENFNILRYIESVVDIDGSDLSHSIQVSGAEDLNQQGTYTLQVYAVNKEREISNIETFILTIE